MTPDAPTGGDSPNLLTPAPGSQPDAANTAPPPSAPYSWTDEGGKFSPDWLDKLGPEYKSESSLQTVQTLQNLAKGYVEQRKMIGKRQSPPSENSTPEEIAAWRKVMGAPENEDGYGSIKPEGVPDELWNAGLEKEARALALKYHLPPAVLKDFAALQAKGTQSAYEAELEKAKAALQEGQMSLRAEWGENFERNRARALSVAASLGIPENDSIFTERPDLLSLFAKAAPTFLGGDKLVQGEPAGITGGIGAQIESIRTSPEYLGQRGGQAQSQAQARLHQLLAAQQHALKAA